MKELSTSKIEQDANILAQKERMDAAWEEKLRA